jgi:V/A-type H+/Na+-transporting ATPase subunit E
MALSDLLAGLKAEADAEADKLDAETRAEVARIDTAAQADAHVFHEQALRAVEDELRREQETRQARARLAAAAVVRQAREDAFHECLAEVRRRLETVRESPSYRTVLRALLRESLAALPAATVLRVDPRDERLAHDLLAELDVELELVATLQTAGGLELARGEDRVARNTVEERFANAEPRLRLLFGRAQHDEVP